MFDFSVDKQMFACYYQFRTNVPEHTIENPTAEIFAETFVKIRESGMIGYLRLRKGKAGNRK